MKDKYKYEIAFSFLSQDEKIAIELNDLIVDRLETFIYSKRQEELGGTDGELVFGKVFGEQSRTVVVLYRDGWGETPWTRIEETAIRNRAFNTGWDFVVYIVLDSNSKAPKYLPKAQLWVDYDRWGLKGAAPIIEQRVKDSGGEARKETIQNRGNRLKRLKKAKIDRTTYLESPEALQDEYKEFAKIIVELKELPPSLKDQESGLYFSISEEENRFFEFGFDGFFLLFKRNSSLHIRSFEDTKLTVIIYQKDGVQDIDYNETIYSKYEYKFDRSLSESYGWSDYKTSKNFMTSRQLIDYWVKNYLDELEKKKI